MLLLNLALSLTLPFSFLKTCEAKLGLTYRFTDPRSRSQTEIGKLKEKNITKTDYSLAAGDVPANKDRANAETTERYADETMVKDTLESISSVADTDKNHEKSAPTDVNNLGKKKIKAGKFTRAIFSSWANLFISFRPVETMSYEAVAHMCLLQPSR